MLWIAVAFALGLVARQIHLPPLVGFLVAGFALHGFGVEPDPIIDDFAAMGVTLLLFTIGLKLKLDTLAQPPIWGAAGLHMVATTLIIALGLTVLGLLPLPFISGLDPAAILLIAFALSFSSTVFAVKVLEDKGELTATYGMIAIGILIIQDLAAVIFLAISAGKMPTPWALALLLLVPGRWLILGLMERAGHGELLVLFGLTLALGGAQLFDAVGVKGDLGALILGVLIASNPKSSELAKALLSFKDLFLVGFFLSIGMQGVPTIEMVSIAVLLVLAIPAKGWLFYRLLLAFKLRSRTSLLGALSLSNYSEFGLIVAAIGASNGWIGADWLMILAIALSLSFVAASPLNAYSHELYERLSTVLARRQRPDLVHYDAEIDPGEADVIILGMGRVGTGAYDTLVAQGRRPVGVDSDNYEVMRQHDAGRHVIHGSATDPDFWHRLQLRQGDIRLVLFALPQLSENVFAAEHLRREGFDGLVGAIAKFPDDEPELRTAGVHLVFDMYAEAGAGFAQHVCSESNCLTRPAAGVE